MAGNMVVIYFLL